MAWSGAIMPMTWRCSKVSRHCVFDLDLPLFRRTAHYDATDAAVACGAYDTAHHFIADAAVLTCRFDGERRFSLWSPVDGEEAQFGEGTYIAVLDMGVNDAADLWPAFDVFDDEAIRDRMREPRPAVRAGKE